MPRILLVEDAPEVREILSAALMAGQHDVLLAGTCAEALPIIEAGTPGLIVADIGLPDCDGHTLAVAADRHGIPSILITGDPGVSEQLEKEGLRCLCKPFAIEDLLSAVARALVPAAGGPKGQRA